VAHTHTDAPSPLLADHIDLLRGAPDKTALDVACGRGRNALFLAEHGFTVTGLELNDEAVAHVRGQAAARHLPVTVEQRDLEAEGVTLPLVAYGLVCVFYYLHRPLLHAIRNTVKPGGFIVYETFLIDAHLRWNTPKRKACAFDPTELLDTFQGFRVHLYRERTDEAARSATAQLIAQRV
jgi:tellurite methyltransferase